MGQYFDTNMYGDYKPFQLSSLADGAISGANFVDSLQNSKSQRTRSDQLNRSAVAADDDAKARLKLAQDDAAQKLTDLQQRRKDENDIRFKTEFSDYLEKLKTLSPDAASEHYYSTGVPSLMQKYGKTENDFPKYDVANNPDIGNRLAVGPEVRYKADEARYLEANKNFGPKATAPAKTVTKTVGQGQDLYAEQSDGSFKLVASGREKPVTGPKLKNVPETAINVLGDELSRLDQITRAKAMIQDPVAANRPLLGQERLDYNKFTGLRHPVEDNSARAIDNRVVSGDKTWLPFVADKPSHPANAEYEKLLGSSTAKPIHDVYAGNISKGEDVRSGFFPSVGQDSATSVSAWDALEAKSKNSIKKILSAYTGGGYIPNPYLQKAMGDRRLGSSSPAMPPPSAPVAAPAPVTSLVGGTPIALQGEAGAELARLRKEFVDDSVATSLSAKAQRARDSARGNK